MEDKMVELARFQTLAEAEMLVSLLKSEGIDCYVRDAVLSQNFFGDESLGLAKVELLAKDVEQAQKIMQDFGYGLPGDSEETPETENDDFYDEIYDEYERRKARLSKTMMFIVISLLVILGLIILLNRFYV
jgi:hypothetical protein